MLNPYCVLSVHITGAPPESEITLRWLPDVQKLLSATMDDGHMQLHDRLRCSEDDIRKWSDKAQSVRAQIATRDRRLAAELQELGQDLLGLLSACQEGGRGVRAKEVFEACCTLVKRAAQDQQRKARCRSLALELKIDHPPLAQLPWELMCERGDLSEFLLTISGSSVVRIIPSDQSLACAAPRIEPPLKVLVIVACPVRLSNKYFDGIDTYSIYEDLRKIQEDSKKNGFPIEFDFHTKVNHSRLSELLKGNHHVLYFIGHGEKLRHPQTDVDEVALLLEDGTRVRSAEPLFFRELNRMLRQSSIRVAVFSSCDSASSRPDEFFKSAAQVLLPSVSAVVAMQSKVPTTTAAAFDVAFFSELAQWSPIETCVAKGREAIIELLNQESGGHFRHCADWAIPVVFRDNSSEPLVDPFVPVPAGKYELGPPPKHAPQAPFRQREEISLECRFEVMRWPVTNLEYARFLRDTNHKPPRDWIRDGAWCSFPDPEGPNHPVVGVSFWDAESYCQWAGLDLPTADELEIAFRAGSTANYPWGNDPDFQKCNTKENTKGVTTSVFAFPFGKNAWGLWDTVGNVYEWTKTGHTDECVILGGSYLHPSEFALPFLRSMADRSKAYPVVGFRCVRRSRAG
jgi:formylglycine-generating enzyme required for sulfatase activity